MIYKTCTRPISVLESVKYRHWFQTALQFVIAMQPNLQIGVKTWRFTRLIGQEEFGQGPA